MAIRVSAANGGATLCIVKKRIPTPVCALARNDGGSRQSPTIILQITMLLFVKGEDLYWLLYFLFLLCYHT